MLRFVGFPTKRNNFDVSINCRVLYGVRHITRRKNLSTPINTIPCKRLELVVILHLDETLYILNKV